MARLFLDLDGVLTDFDTQFERWFGVKTEVRLYKTDHDVRCVIDDHLAAASEAFWADMPWLPGAEDFWNEMLPHSPIILSSPHFAPACGPGKYSWVRSRLGAEVPVVLDSAKGTYGQPGDILVDDTPSNAWGWKGHFILHSDWKETRRQIGSFLYHRESQV